MHRRFILPLFATITIAGSATWAGAQTLPSSLLDNPDFVVHVVGSEGSASAIEAAAGATMSDTSASNPDNTALTTSRFSIFRTLFALRRVRYIDAGAPSKEVIVPAPPAPGPEVYLEMDWSSIHDKRGFDLDGNRFAPRLGADFVGPAGVVLGGSFTFSYEDRSSSNNPISSKIESYIFNVYAGKTFFDWINTGLTLTYAYEDQIAKAFGGRFYGDNHLFSVAPFIGVGHTFGSFSFSSTATYIYQHNDLSVDASPNLALGGGFDSHTYLHINEIEYAVTDKLTVGANANFNVVIDEDQNAFTAAFGSTDDFWMTFGGRISYQLLENVSASVQFQADVFNDDYNNYLTSVGVTWSF